MPSIEDRMKAYKATLENIEAEERQKHAQHQLALENIFANRPKKVEPGTLDAQNFDHLLQEFDQSQSLPVAAQVDFSSKNRINDLDRQFITIFELDQYLDTEFIKYPTVYCETLEEFFAPIYNRISASTFTKKQFLKKAVDMAAENAEKGGIYGVNLPGTGCYINGWLFSTPYGFSARRALEHPELLNKILLTVVHEKLGHGFLDIFSSLGKVGTKLGSYQLQLAQQFGMQLATDPVDKVRQQQLGILYSNFIFLNEGWATWLESFFSAVVFGQGDYPKHSLQQLLEAVDGLSALSQTDEEGINASKIALALILDDEFHPPADLLAGIKFLHHLDRITDAYFSSKLGQPLRYVLGELIMAKASVNLGKRCVPFAALIAANISFDPEKISLTDMRELFHSDPQLNPDARMVMLSKLKLKEHDNIDELAFQAENYLNLQLPRNMKDQ
jgi:hypothetical protein